MVMATFVAGADGCPRGWAVVLREIAGRKPPEFVICADIGALLRHPRLPAMIAVDMPIGLPDRVGAGGRGPEAEVRPLLGERKSSVFSIPARAAVYAEDFDQACALAAATSDPPRKVSIQAFHLFPKIRQIDEAMRQDPGLATIVKECHPEVAFMRMNGGEALSEPKKVKSAVHEPGIRQRKALLMEVAGYEAEFLDRPTPPGVGVDDFIDACACAYVAGKLARGEAASYPAQPARDAHGIPMAIWA
jgi:predicted RNase H-like nuclease